MIIHDQVIDDEYIISNLKNKSDADSIKRRVTFYNCTFMHRFIDEVFNGSKFINCTFTNESFTIVRFNKCTFKNIIFEDNPRRCFIKCALFNCSYDEAFEQSFAETAPFPKTGSFIAWKKANILLNNEDRDHIINPMKLLYAGKPMDHEYASCIIELLIPEDAKRSCAFSNKCRCDKAKVLGIQSIYGQSFPTDTIAYSNYDPAFAYRVGEIITPREPFDLDPFNECSSGIHFFMSREDAVNY